MGSKQRDSGVPSTFRRDERQGARRRGYVFGRVTSYSGRRPDCRLAPALEGSLGDGNVKIFADGKVSTQRERIRAVAHAYGVLP